MSSRGMPAPQGKHGVCPGSALGKDNRWGESAKPLIFGKEVVS